MLTVVQWAFWVIGLGLQVLLTVALSQGAGREFPILFAYILCLLVTTAVDILAITFFGRTSFSYQRYYWSAELVRQSVLFAMVVSLAMHMMPAGRKSDAAARLMAIAGAVIWIGSVLICYSPKLNIWMTTVVRNLSFFTGVLNLVVWFIFAKSEPRDTQRLMIAGGLGLQMTGEAIGQALRQMNLSRDVSFAGSIFVVLTHFLCLFIWWRALVQDRRYA